MAGHEHGGPDDHKMEALAKQLAELERQAEEVANAMHRSASIRRLLIVVVAALLGIYGYLFYKTGRSFTDKAYTDRLMEELQKSAESNTDIVLREVRELVKNTTPTVSKAMAEQFDKDKATLMNLMGAERETLAVNLQDRLEGKVRGHYAKAIDKHRDILSELFPNVKDDRDLELMSDNFKDAFRPLVRQYYGEKIKSEFNKMYATWDNFPPDTSKRDQEELSRELYNLLFALMQTKLAASEAQAAQAAKVDSSGS